MDRNQFNSFLKSKVKKEALRRVDDFSKNTSQYYKSLEEQRSSLFQDAARGKALSNNDLEIYRKSVDKVKKLTADSSFNKEQKQGLNEQNGFFSKSIELLGEYNSLNKQQRALQEQRDEADSKAFWNKLGGTVLSALAAMGGGENASNALQIRENSQAEINATDKYDKQSADLQKQINDNYNKYVAFLDREALQKSLHDGSKKGKEKAYAKEDFQAADEYQKAVLANEAINNSREVQALVSGAASATSKAQESKTKVLSTGIIGAISQVKDPEAAKNINDWITNKKYAKLNKEKIVEDLKAMGYETSNGITAEDIAEYLTDKETRKINLEKSQELTKEIEQLEQMHPVAGSLLLNTAALATAPLKTLGTANTLVKTIEGWIRDEKVYIDANNPIYSFNNLYSKVVSTTAANITAKYGEGAAAAYQFGVTLADNAIRAATTWALDGGKVAEAITLVSMGLGVMNDTAVELTNLGMDAKHAGTLAFIAGGAEIATELIPLDNLMDMLKNKSVLPKKEIIRQLVGQILIEGAEEGMSDVINDVADLVYDLASVDPSRRQLEIEQLMKNEGLTYEEAYRRWTHEHTMEYIKDIAGGMLSGALMSGPVMGVNYVANNRAAGKNVMQYNADESEAEKFQRYQDNNANILSNKEAKKLLKQRTQEVVSAVQQESGGRMTAGAANIAARQMGAIETDNAAYDSLIAKGLNSTDSSVQKQAQKLAEMRNAGKKSLMGIGKLQNLMAREATNTSIGVASQVMEEIGAGEKVKDTLITAIKQEKLSNKDLRLLLNDENARNLISDLSGITIDEDSSIADLEEAIAHTYGNSFSMIDNSTEDGRAYTLAAQLKADGAFGTDEDGRVLGTNAVKAFYSSFSPVAGLTLDQHSDLFQLAYNLRYAGNSEEAVAKRLSSSLTGLDRSTYEARSTVVQAAEQAADADKKLLKQQKEERALKKKEREKAQEKRRSEKKQKEAAQQREYMEKLKQARRAAGTEDEVREALESGVLKEGENVKTHADSLTVENRNESSERFLNKRIAKVKQSGGGAVIYKSANTKLSGTQATVIAFYEYVGKKRGLTYVFSDALGEDFGGEYSDKVITVSLDGANSMIAAAGHELGHYLKQNYDKEYKALTKYVIEALEANGESIAAQVVRVQETYRKATNQNLTYDEALEEIVCNSLFSVDIKSAEFEAFLKEHISLGERILKFIEEWLENLEHFFGTVTGIKEVEVLRNDAAYMQEIAERVGEILGKAQKNSTTDQSGVSYLVGVSQKDIDEYVENAFENNGKNTEYIKYAPVSDRLAADIGNEIADIKSYTHALRDNDIRHIRNSHGERTNEKYPVTESDIEKIPEIVEFYDKVYKVKNNGIYYVKVYDGGVVYYLEQATTQHGKDKLLINKQMIKSSTDTLPTLKSLIDAINKKEGTTKFLNDLKNPSGHIRNGVSSTSINSISDSSKKSNSDYQIEKNKAVMTQERLDDEIENSGAGRRTDYANSWITAISPGDFLNLTSQETFLNRDDFDKHAGGDHGGTMDEWDYDSALKSYGTPYLQVNIDSGKVETYDGRHRMRALEKKGIKSVEILVEFYKDGRKVKYATDSQTAFDTRVETKKEFTLKSAYGVAGTDATVYNIIPLNEDHRSEIEASYGEKANQNAAIKYQVSDRDYMQAARNGDEEKAAEYVEQAANEWGAYAGKDGKPIYFYHGTGRADRVGNYFNPERATSGPMAFFTDNKEIATDYSKNKADTSLSYDEQYDSYYTQFRVKQGTKTVPVSDLWNTLNYRQKAEMKERAKHITFEEDGEEIIFDESAQYGVGNFTEYDLHMHNGNVIDTMIDSWLESAFLLEQEERFIQVLEMLGIHNVQYFNPNAREEKVYSTFLAIKNPFVTKHDINQQFIDELKVFVENADLSKYQKENRNADLWDKNSTDINRWIERLESDFQDGTLYSWTTIPDVVTDFLKSKGYDGIIDIGGKGGGERHTVAIPFYSNQIKSADPITYDDNGEIIPLSERFSDDKDIRYSVKDSDGNTLSQEQADFFKNSKVRDSAGNLLVLYHGTPNEFYVFDTQKHGGKNGWAFGRGINLTSDKSLAGKFGERIMPLYANIERPAQADKITISKEELISLVKASAEYEAQRWVDDGEYNSVEEALPDGFISLYGGTYSQAARQLLDSNTNDVDIIMEIMNTIGLNHTYADAAAFYDNVLTPTIGVDGFQSDNVFITFRSSQNKLVSNKTPTNDEDVRYSVKDKDDSDDNLPQRGKQLIYDREPTDTIREQEAEIARFARQSGVYRESRAKIKTYGDRIALLRRQMTTTFKTPTYRHEAVAKVADAFLEKYKVDALDAGEKKAFINALHDMYQQLDGVHRLGYRDSKGKYHEALPNAQELADAYAEKAIGIIRDYMTVKQEDNGELQHIKEYFTDKKVVRLTSVQWQELRSMYDTVAAANKDVPYIRFAQAQPGEQNTLDDHWQELGLDSDVNEGDQVSELIDLLKTIKNGSAQRVNFFEQEVSQEELMNEAIFELQNTWAEVQWQLTFADDRRVTVAAAEQADREAAKKTGKKTNQNLARVALYKKELEKTMQFSEKALAELQNAYAKENEKTLATLRALGEALAAEQENAKRLGNEVRDAKADVTFAQNDNRKLTKTVADLTKNNQALADYVESLTEEKKQALIDYAEASKKLRRSEKKVAKREEWLEAEKEKHNHKLAEVRLHRDWLLAEYKQKEEQRRKEATERKRQTELRGKIRRKFITIASLAAANSKTRHVPNGLINAVKEMLQAFNIDGAAGNKIGQYLYRIGEQFERIAEDEQYTAAYSAYTSGIQAMIKGIQANYDSNIPLSKMTAEELEDINDLANAVTKLITEGNRTFAENIKENIDELQDMTVAELREKNADKKTERERKSQLKQLFVDNLKPVYFFRQLGSETLEKLFNNVYDGENTWANDIADARDKEQELRDKYNYYDWNQAETFTFELSGANTGEKQTLELNLQQIMTLYALARREDAQGRLVAWDHLLEGGIRKLNGTEAHRGFFKSRKLKLDETIYKFTESEIKNIVDKLTDEQKGFVQEAQQYLSKDVAKWGNAVSEKLYDVHLFTGKIYFPMQSDKQWVEEREQKTTGARQIKNFGASQQLIKHANNPLVLGEFNDVFGNHIDEMALYHAFVLPLEDLQRVYGYYSTKKNSSVRHLLGRYNQTYIDQLLQDLNGGVKASADIDLGGRMVSRWKKVSVSLNSSVIIQQPSAVGRAFVYINPKYFTPVRNTEKLREEMMTYAPIARIKSMGYFDVDLGRTATEFINENEYSGLKEKGKAVFTDRNYRENLLTIGAEKADEITWVHIWNAAKRKAKAQGFTGEEQLQKAGEIFTECIRMTQVYDSVFARSGNMRKKGFLAQAATAFMSEPTTAYNMMVDAYSGLKDGRTTKKFAAGVTASVITATVMNAMLKAIVQSLRHADDDDDILEQYPGEVIGNIFDDINPINYIPIVKDMYAALAGQDIERPDMTLITDLAGKLKKVLAAPTDGKRWADLAASTAQVFGIPTVSVLREYRQARNLVKHIFTDERVKPTVEGVVNGIENAIADAAPISSEIAKNAGAEKFLQKNTGNYDMIYRLIQSGNKEEAMKRFRKMQKKDEKFTDKSLQSGIRTLLKKDENIIKAAQLWNAGKAKEARAALDADSIKNFDINDRLYATMAKARELNKGEPTTEANDKDYAEDFETGAIKNTDYVQKAAQGILDADYYAVEENFNALVQMGYGEEDAEKAIISIANKMGKEDEDYISGSADKSLRYNALLNHSDIKAAAIASHEGNVDERVRLQDSLIDSGYTMNEVGAAIKKAENKLYPKQDDEESGEKTYYKYRASDVISYLKSGDTGSARYVTTYLMDAYENDGKKPESAKQAIRTKIAEEYKEKYQQTSFANREKIKQLMLASGAYKSEKSVNTVCKNWLKKE